jgi:phenylacetate-CoA ligase
MPDHYDRLEGRDPFARERAQFKTLRTMLAYSKAKAPGLRRQLKGIEPKEIMNRAALTAIPVIRKSDLKELQSPESPFGGLTATKPGALGRLFLSPGPIADPEGLASDWWGAARALYAAGFRKGDIVQNTFSYHLTPGGFILESGARALGCAVIPAGPGNTEQQLDCIRHFHPIGYVGVPDFLKALLDKCTEAGVNQPFKKALVSGAAFPPSLQNVIADYGVDAYQAYATADLGVVAYETAARNGLVVNETVIVEILRPGTGDPVPDGEVGEVVVTRLNADYPLLRFATGDLSKVVKGKSACGRTGMRLAGWLGRADQTTKVKGMFVHPGTIAEVMKRHPEIHKVRLVVERKGEQDVMTLQAETRRKVADGLAGVVSDTLQALTKLRGSVELVAPGTLPNDGKIIADERPVG